MIDQIDDLLRQVTRDINKGKKKKSMMITLMAKQILAWWMAFEDSFNLLLSVCACFLFYIICYLVLPI